VRERRAGEVGLVAVDQVLGRDVRVVRADEPLGVVGLRPLERLANPRDGGLEEGFLRIVRLRRQGRCRSGSSMDPLGESDEVAPRGGVGLLDGEKMTVVSAGPSITVLLDKARAAYARSDWETAREKFQQALDAEISAEALDGLGQTLWWLGEEEEAIALRTKAFAEYRRHGDADAAANVAIYLAAEYRIAGNASVANGWLGRGTRLLEDCGDCPAQVWLHIERSKRSPTPEQAGDEAQTAVDLARRIGDAALEGAALSHAGRAQIARGEDQAGMALLDEAMAIATSVESEDPLAIGDACCTTLTACERLADPQRALDWGRAISEFFRRRRFLPLLSWCRSVYAGFLIATGQWQEAESTLAAALEDEAALPNPNRTAALVRLGDLRLRQGRLEEAARLLAGLEDRPAALRPIVQLQLARGDVELAAEKVERQFESLGDRAAAGSLLTLRAEVEIARSNASAAAEASAAAAALSGRDDLTALAAVLAARSARLGGESPNLAELQSAMERFADFGMVLEEAEARVELARALASERPQSAIEQARTALRTFERLGAARHADEAAQLLRELGAPGRTAPRTRSALTRREQQVLQLLGEGLSNPQIADRLVISPRTAEHHVRNVLSKLELSNRAEAAAYAVRESIRAGG
jgi:DNA-binding CsgD family transcriptional regulator